MRFNDFIRILILLFTIILPGCKTNPDWIIGDWFENSNNSNFQFNMKITENEYYYCEGILNNEWKKLDIKSEKKYENRLIALNIKIDDYYGWIYLMRVNNRQLNVYFSDKFEDFSTKYFSNERILIRY
ncbi:MAG: hypothetical protein II821_04980 [Treponema sp.]|nr:hypothetical protein [Treponema sp.]